MPLDLSDDETAALLRELDHIIDRDRVPGVAAYPDFERGSGYARVKAVTQLRRHR
jgi:hypothetical protein